MDERLPTWFRVTTPWAPFYGSSCADKPLTGYHAVCSCYGGSFQIGFVGGSSRELAGSEAADASAVHGMGGDVGLLWFLLNPPRAGGRFRQGPGMVARRTRDRPVFPSTTGAPWLLRWRWRVRRRHDRHVRSAEAAGGAAGR